MLNWRNTLSDLEDAGDQLMSAANSVGKSAKQVSSQIESWASDGYQRVRGAGKSDAAFWGAIAVGMSACVGGLYALGMTAANSPRGKRVIRSVNRNLKSLNSDLKKGRKRVVRAVAAANRDMNKFVRSMPMIGSKPTRKRSTGKISSTRSRSMQRRKAA